MQSNKPSQPKYPSGVYLPHLTSKTFLRGELVVPGDKSISHRAVMLGALAHGKTRIRHFLQGADCLSTISCFRRMGIRIDQNEEEVIIHGKGLHGLTAPDKALDCGNSGTTMRLLSGILCGQPFHSRLTGDASLCRRPMGRIITPLRMMGADIESEAQNQCAPLLIQSAPLHGIRYTSPVASAQVKSALLLAGLYADGDTSVTEPYISRDHTELMLSRFGGIIRRSGNSVCVAPFPTLEGQEITVPGDISSAAYFIAAGLLLPGSRIVLKNVSINPTRDGILKVAKAMGGNIKTENISHNHGEPTADLVVTASSLEGTQIGGDIIPTLIDELPILAVMAAFARGTTVIRDATELRVKESDRIQVMTDNLRAMGCDVEATSDGMIIRGGNPLHGAVIPSHKDHRIAMSFAVASLLADGETQILDKECVDISFPTFYQALAHLSCS
ncbi:MAG: 3-phosphoshikimate 1-carboxyvinyltransferase [Lachnospiraceae bacterium]|nr:3-phosphoshikimate 1-carboxyvinyltransferase [Lachnospiraceae bacterium]